MNRRERDAQKPKFSEPTGAWPRVEKPGAAIRRAKAVLSHDPGPDQKREEKRKRDKKIASLMGQAGEMGRRAEKIADADRIPYRVQYNKWARPIGAVCEGCTLALDVAPNGLSYRVHTKQTCPGPAGRVMQ